MASKFLKGRLASFLPSIPGLNSLPGLPKVPGLGKVPGLSKLPGLGKAPPKPPSLLDKILDFFRKIPGLKHLLPDPKALIHIPKGTSAALGSISGLAPGILSKLNPFNWKIFNRKKIAEEEDDQKFQAGESYGDPKVMATGIVSDLKSMGLKTSVKDLQTLFEVAKSTGKPINDRDMTVSLVQDRLEKLNQSLTLKYRWKK